MEMTTFCDVVQQRSAATPGTYDGGGSVTLSDKARRILAVIMSTSMSTQTADEGGQPILKLSSDSIASLATTAYILYGIPDMSGPATNASCFILPYEIIPLNLPCAGNNKLSIDATSTGATQTGTYDQTHGVMYCDVMPPPDWQAKFPNCVPAVSGVANWQAIATTTETKLATHESSSDNRIPSQAREIIAIKPNISKDGAVTAAQEMIGYVRLEGSGFGFGTSKWPTNGIVGGLGTEVDLNGPHLCPYIPCHMGPLPAADIIVTMYINLYGAVTGSVQAACGLLWR